MAARAVGGLAGAVLLGLTASYRHGRIAAFLSPATRPAGPGFQARQALYSLADGGLFGVGLGQGRAKWSYLPNAHNDFIFAIIGEELGFVGAFAVLALFATLAYAGLRIAARNVRPVAPARRRHVDDLAGRPGRHQHRLRRRPAPGHRAAAAADLLRRHLARGHHVRVRAAGQRGPPRAGGHRGADPRRPRCPAGQRRRPPPAAPAAPALPGPAGRFPTGAGRVR